MLLLADTLSARQPNVPMTNKRIKIQDLLNNETVVEDAQPRLLHSAQTPLKPVPTSVASTYNTSTATVYANEPSVTTTNDTPVNSLPGRYSFSSSTTLPPSTRLLSNTLPGSGPLLPLHMHAASTSQSPQLPPFQLKTEGLSPGIGGFSPLMHVNHTNSPNMLPMASSPHPQNVRTPLGGSPGVAKPPHHTERPLRQQQLMAVAMHEQDHQMIQSGSAPSVGSDNSSHRKLSPELVAAVSLSASNVSNFQYKINKPQGRPIIQSIIGKFTLYANIQDLILDITRFDRIRLRDVFNESLGTFELIRYSKEDLQLHHHNQNSDSDSAAQEPTTPHSNASIQKNLVINEAHVYDKLTQEFQCQYLKFIKIIRDKKGKLIRLESVIIPNTNEITIDFIKKKICYPRYKSNMKIYLIKCDAPEEFQNKFIYIHDSQSLEDGKNLVNIDNLDKDLEQFKNLTIWCRNE